MRRVGRRGKNASSGWVKQTCVGNEKHIEVMLNEVVIDGRRVGG
jgi:hypothetical protein